MSMFFDADRALAVHGPAIPLIAGEPALVALSLQGREGINSLFEYRLVLQTPDAPGPGLGTSAGAGMGANFDLSAFVGRELTCAIELEGHGSFVPGVPGGLGAHHGAGVRELCGLVTQARFLGEHGRHARYALTLRPWLHLATLTTDCRVFQDQSPVEIIEGILARYAFACERRLIEAYPRVDYTVQYNESDFEFVTRLMQAWGINYHFEHTGGVHRLVWSDHNGAFGAFEPGRDGRGGRDGRDGRRDRGEAPGAYHRIPFHPPSQRIDQEHIHALSPCEALTSGSYASRDHDHTRPRATLEAQAAAPRPTGHAHQAVYLWRGDRAGLGGSDYSQPNRGADRTANRTEAQGEHLARLRMELLRQGGHRATGAGRVRGIVPGHAFTLTHHPRASANVAYIVLEARLVIENVGEDSQRAQDSQTASEAGAQGPAELAVPGDAARPSGRWRVGVEFDVQPLAEALRPEAVQRKPKTGGPETAVVVGPGAATAETNLYTDSLGRIKVQFPWDRHGRHDHLSSCWVRVANDWAGNQLGAMHLPRVGQEVVVSFLGGDPDLPLVTGRVHNQLNPPPWELPAQQALSGLRSRELTPGGGNAAPGRGNHLILDDTAQAIQAQLRSDHQHSSLSLGHLTRIEDNAGRQDARGEGFELRTDGHGVVRAKDGLLITTEGRVGARSHAKAMGETTQRLAHGQDQHGRLADLAQQHRAQEAGDQDEVARVIEAQNADIEGRGQGSEAGDFPELSEPHLTLASPAGIQSTTAGSTHQHSGQHHAITAGGHASVSTAKSWLASAEQAIRMFAYRAGLRIVSAVADIDIQALDRSINVLAKLDINQTANRITLNARERVTINGGGSHTVWDARGITSGTTGAHTVHAASHARARPKGIGVDVAGRWRTDSHSEQFEWLSPTGAPLAQRPYGVSSAQAGHHGLTPETGQLPTIHSAAPEEIQVRRVWAEFEIPDATPPSATTTPTKS
ncbi:type VI secretion system tip protein VgrG [Comamonadaceae bacterium OTU4NAUVB1]|nr:type VI secretion system tip protein VgrG [Comamonadaceae bacterium OTU4NAUVB1]